MFPAKIYVGQIAVVFGIVTTSTWGATQWTAHALGYQGGLGSRWFSVSGYPVYLRWRVFEWWYAYDAYAPEIFERAGAITAGGGIAGALFAVVNSVWRVRQNQLVTTYGSARWASSKEIAKAGLFEPKGVFGCVDQRYLRHDGPEHVMCFAPTRSGKGVGLVLPTLLGVGTQLSLGIDESGLVKADFKWLCANIHYLGGNGSCETGMLVFGHDDNPRCPIQNRQCAARSHRRVPARLAPAPPAQPA